MMLIYENHIDSISKHKKIIKYNSKNTKKKVVLYSMFKLKKNFRIWSACMWHIIRIKWEHMCGYICIT